MAIQFKHTQTGLIKKCPEGFSWTYFFFGPLVGIIRGMWIPFIVSMCTMGFANLYYMFVVNRMYAEALMERGFVPASEADRQKLVALGFMAPKDSKEVAA